MKSKEIREKFLKYFESHGHERVKSSSLIPAADPTLLFTNAGMVQFKDVFLGVVNPGYRRATTAQKCVRAGGKHNDLENVGFTPRHHTFFEMMGNFSFGDYFKEEAISFAWKFLTEELKIPKDRLRITVYKDDDEALEIWKKQGVRPDWIEKLGEKDNFWAMGDTGPCGPCTEIHYDWGDKYSNANSPGTDASGKRFLEIWNLVFMQFNRDSNGNMNPLPKPSVDTGAGLERLAAVMQGAYSNYDNDLFQPILQKIAKRVGKVYGAQAEDDVAMRVISDHLRSSTFLMGDGVIPSNEGRGYVLRRILRRAIRYGKKLGQEKPFIFELVSAVTDSLGTFYPEIVENQKIIQTLLREEEERFHETLHRGMGILEEALKKVSQQRKETLPGETAFLLYDSYGFPLDLVEVICIEHQIKVDHAGFESLMAKQRSQSGKENSDDKILLENIAQVIESKSLKSHFVGYETLNCLGNLFGLFDSEGKPIKNLDKEGYVVLDKTPFYAESGGQVGDKGTIQTGKNSAEILTTFKVAKQPVLRVKVRSGSLVINETYQLQVDPTLRKFTMRNHTATHLLHAALRRRLGERVKQAGSLVEPERLRFDFTYPKAVSHEELRQIENEVNQQVFHGLPVAVSEMSYDSAIGQGALAFFDEKYGNQVRVVRIGNGEEPFSVELCGGTHISNLSEIGYFKIISESSVASGVRRIEAVTSEKAFHYLSQRETLFSQLENRLGVKESSVLEKVDGFGAQLKALQKEVEQLKIKSLRGSGSQSSDSAHAFEVIQGVKLVIQQVEETDPKVLRSLVDQLRDKNSSKAVILVVGTLDGKVSLCAGLTKDLVGIFDAGKIIQHLAGEIGGKGGGRPDFAQAGGTNPEGVPAALNKMRSWLESQK